MKVALVENFGADFVGARLRFAMYLKNKGVSVIAIIPNDGHKALIEDKGIKVIEVGGNIRAKGITTKLHYAKKIKDILKDNEFDIIHFYRLQPNLIGTFIAGITTNSKIVNHVTGLGVAFTTKSFKNRFLQTIIKSFYLFNNSLFKPYTIFQNKQDSLDLGIKNRVSCIEGSAVNEDRFNTKYKLSSLEELTYLKEELGLVSDKNAITLIFVSRLLKEKGVLDLIEATKQAIKTHNKTINLLIIGWSDDQNPSAVKTSKISELINGVHNIKFLGKRTDVDKLIALSDISILPTYYREGTPRFLLESMAMGKPIITSDMPGCNHLIPNGNNGILIQPKNISQIKKSIIELSNKDLLQLGDESEKLYIERFSEEKVYSSILKLYKSIL